jgi:hypothetical protein
MEDKDCCGGDPDAGLPGAGNGECDKAPGALVGRCGNGNACNPQGAICHYKDYTCGVSSASANCCGGLGAKSGECRLDTLGVPRCNGLGTTCMTAGQECASSSDCCGNVPCTRDAQGVLRCAAGTCVAPGGSCTINGDCCPGTSCIIAQGSTSGTCGIPVQLGTGGAPGTGGASAIATTTGGTTSTPDTNLGGSIGTGGDTTQGDTGGNAAAGGEAGTGGAPATGGSPFVCSQYGQLCNATSDCCNGVPCTCTDSTCVLNTCHFPIN